MVLTGISTEADLHAAAAAAEAGGDVPLPDDVLPDLWALPRLLDGFGI
jgi:hypothetical protein